MLSELDLQNSQASNWGNADGVSFWHSDQVLVTFSNREICNTSVSSSGNFSRPGAVWQLVTVTPRNLGMWEMLPWNGLWASVSISRGNTQHSPKFKKQTGPTGLALDDRWRLSRRRTCTPPVIRGRYFLPAGRLLDSWKTQLSPGPVHLTCPEMSSSNTR